MPGEDGLSICRRAAVPAPTGPSPSSLTARSEFTSGCRPRSRRRRLPLQTIRNPRTARPRVRAALRRTGDACARIPPAGARRASSFAGWPPRRISRRELRSPASATRWSISVPPSSTCSPPSSSVLQLVLTRDQLLDLRGDERPRRSIAPLTSTSASCRHRLASTPRNPHSSSTVHGSEDTSSRPMSP